MFDEIIKSAQTQISERLASPLIGSFVISWCLWNYKFLVILFSAASVSQTFRLVDSVAFPDISSLLVKGIFLPALTSAAYIFAYPYPAKFVYEFTRRRQKDINDIRRRIDDETPLTLEESRKIRSDLLRIGIEHEQELDRKNIEIERLKAEVGLLRSSTEQTNSKSPNETPLTLEPTQLAILRLVEQLKGVAPESTILAKSAQSKVKTEFDLGELVRMKLLKKEYDGRQSGYYYEFTHAGRGVLLAHKSEEA